MHTSATASLPFILTPTSGGASLKPTRTTRHAGISGPMRLPKGALASITRPRAHTIECVQGLIWITHDNEADDILLSAGERHLAVSNARMIVQGLESSEVHVHAPPGRRPRTPFEAWTRTLSDLWAAAFPARLDRR